MKFLHSGCTLFSFVLKWWICYSAFCFFVTFFILFSDSYLNKPDHSTERVYRGKFRNHPHSLSPYWLTGWDGLSQKVPIGWRVGMGSAKVSHWLTGCDSQPGHVPIGCYIFTKCPYWLTGCESQPSPVPIGCYNVASVLLVDWLW